jgi:acetate kinase
VEDREQDVLALNGGSSSIKFALYRMTDPLQRRLAGAVDRIGSSGAMFRIEGPDRKEQDRRDIGHADHASAARFLFDLLDQQIGLGSLRAVGHRVAHGGPKYTAPALVTDDVLAELHRLGMLAPDHVPAEMALIELCRRRLPNAAQVACFDTSFHRDMPRVAKMLALPRRLQAKGIERYGFHGLSYAYLMEELSRIAGVEAARQRVILAHLGNGASLAAVRDLMSIDTSMAFSPASGVPMSTRSGDFDPGLVLYLAQTEGMTAAQFHHMVNHRSGLLGISETSSDVRDLLNREPDDVRASEAIALFCYQVRKWIGAFAAALGGVDSLVFSGGIGEHSSAIRARICEGLGFLGIELDAGRNEANQAVISTDACRTRVRVIPTDEELMIARAVVRQLRGSPTTHGIDARSER